MNCRRFHRSSHDAPLKKTQRGITFVEVAIVFPFAIFLIMGMIDFGLLMLSRYQMTSMASMIANRIKDTPRMSGSDVNSIASLALDGLNGTGESVGIQTFDSVPTGNWVSGVDAGARNYTLAADNYWVGVVVRMNVKSATVLSPFLKNLLPSGTQVASAVVAVKNIQNCGPDRVMVSDNQGGFRCGPDCGPRQFPMVNMADSTVVCGPPATAGQFLRMNADGILQGVTIPTCTGEQVLRFNGTNFVCMELGAILPTCSGAGKTFRSNGSDVWCHTLEITTSTLVNEFGPHNTEENCANIRTCSAGAFVTEYEDRDINLSGDHNCRIKCSKPGLN